MLNTFTFKVAHPYCEILKSDKFASASETLSSYLLRFLLLASWLVPQSEFF